MDASIGDVLIRPHGGNLVDLMVSRNEASRLLESSKDWYSWDLTLRQLCDLELLLNGSFSPLNGFMNRSDYESVVQDMRLSNGLVWSIPIVLDVYEDLARKIGPGTVLALRNPEGAILAVLDVEDIWQPDRLDEAKEVYQSTSCSHPGVNYLVNQTNPWYVGGRIRGVLSPAHYDFLSLRLSPIQMRQKFLKYNWKKIVAFQTRNPLHKAHQEITLQATSAIDANLLIHPVVGMSRPGDIDHFTRVRCYQVIQHHYPEGKMMLGILPLAMRLAGPREAIWHALIRKNYGCTHIIIGRDHASPGSDQEGRPFYQPYEAQDSLKNYEEEVEIQPIPFHEMCYVKNLNTYLPKNKIPEGTETLSISGTELRRRLREGEEIPSWFSFAEVVEELRRTHPPREKQGFTIFLTGLSASGKSTIANILAIKLLELGGRPVTLLDGDIVRKYLSQELGFSKNDRDMNIRRIGFVASEITKNSGIAICAPIAPYENTRKEVRSNIEKVGGFILVHIATSLEICEKRDIKGLYAKARAGMIDNFTGVSDPYEIPLNPEVVIDNSEQSPEDSAQQILDFLVKQRYIRKYQ